MLFQQVSCIKSPSSKHGISATGISGAASANPIFLSVNNDGSTINPIMLRFGQTTEWTDGRLTVKPKVSRSGKTIIFSGAVLLSGKSSGRKITLSGRLSCGKIADVIG